MSVFESTAYLKFTKLQHVFLWLSLHSHYKVTDEAFLAETSKYDPSTFLRMCSLLLKERTFVFLFAICAILLILLENHHYHRYHLHHYRPRPRRRRHHHQ